jgi:hypothetical protein
MVQTAHNFKGSRATGPLSATTLPPGEPAAAAAAIGRLLAQEPKLGDFGFGVFDWQQKPLQCQEISAPSTALRCCS